MHPVAQRRRDGGEGAQLATLHRQDQIRFGEHPQIDLAGGMAIQSKTIFLQQLGGHRVHAIADPCGQTGGAHVGATAQARAQDGLGHRAPADVADADNQDPIHRHIVDGVWHSLPAGACRACMRTFFTCSSGHPH